VNTSVVPSARHITLGKLTFSTPLILAPIAGYCDSVFRRIVRGFGADMVVTELISAFGLIYRSSKTDALMAFSDSEHPIAIQLFGNDAEPLAEAARIVEQTGCDALDINLGCSVPKVIKQGACASLTRNPALLQKILARIVNSVSLPVTCKIRSGWDSEHQNCVDVARAAQDAGIRMITIHGRTSKQGFTGSADWGHIRDVVQAVQIPVIGNGDVVTADDARRMLEQTGCAGVMIGRAALENPEIFREARAFLDAGIPPQPLTVRRRLAYAQYHLMALKDSSKYPAHQSYDSLRAARHIRKHLMWYFRDFTGAKELRGELVRLSSLDQMLHRISEFCQASSDEFLDSEAPSSLGKEEHGGFAGWEN